MGAWLNTIGEKLMSSSNLFITGCDKNTRWQLPWFKENFYKHNKNATLKVYDFDTELPEKRWFKKPAAMLDASYLATNVCWLDTDIEVRHNVENIFEHVVSNKLTIVVDEPWTKRKQEVWHNTGVVAFTGRPPILQYWADACSSADQTPKALYGDQDILHELVRAGMNNLIHLNVLPKQYNTLRIDLLDNTQPANIKMMHWTGQKGNEHIRSLIENG